MNFLYVQLSWILMLVAHDASRMILLTQQVKKSIINLPISQITMSCVDLLFCTNQNTISSYGVDVSIFEKCNHNIFLARLTSVYHSFQYISAKSEITVKQTWKILSMQYLILIGVKLLKIFA